MKKRILAVFLAALMVLSLMPATVFAVSEEEAVAAIGTTLYESLQTAVAAATVGQTVTMKKGVENVGPINLPAGVTLDGNGCKISGNSAVYINKDGGTVKNVVFENISGGSGTLSAIYAAGLEGEAQVTGCTFDNVEYDAIQMTPVAGATVTITGNTFRHSASGTAQRFVHVESGQNVDFAATVTGNKFYDCAKLAATGLEVYYIKDASKMDCSGNYMDAPIGVCLLTGDNVAATEKAFPFKDENLENDVEVVAAVRSAGLDQYQDQYLYASISEAFAATTGQEVTLLKDCSVSEPLEVDGKSFTFNTNGKTLSYNGANSNLGVIIVHNGATLTITGNGKIASGDNIYSAVLVTKAGDSSDKPATLNVQSGVTLEGKYYGIVGNGSRDNTKINVYEATVIGKEGAGIFHPQAGTLTISHNNAVISGAESAVEMRAGTLNLKAGTLTSTATGYSVTKNGSGSTTIGAALAIAQHTTKKDIKVTVKEAYDTSILVLNGVNAVSVANPEGNDSTNVTVTLNKATYNGPLAYSADGNATITKKNDAVPAAPSGYKWDENGILVKCGSVAEIGDEKYNSLADAIAAVPTGVETATEIDVIADISEEFATENDLIIPSNKNIVLDLNGHTVAAHGTRNGASYFIYNKGYLTIQDSSEEETGVLTYVSDHPDLGYWYGTSTILNRGELTLESGKVGNTTIGGASYAVDSQTLWYDDLIPVVFVMNGGTASCTTGDAAIRQGATLGEKYLKNGQIVGNDITINGGTVEGDIWIQSAAVDGVGSHSTLTIIGGTITGKVYDTLTGDGSNLRYDISGGYIGKVDMHRIGKGSFKEGFVSGGYFKNEVLASEIANAKTCVLIEDLAQPSAEDTAAKEAGYIYKIDDVASDVTVAEVDETKVEAIKGDVADAVAEEIAGSLEEEQAEVLGEAVEAAVEELIGNTEVTKVETNAADAVKDDSINSIIARAAEQAEEKAAGSGAAFTGGTDVSTDTKIEIKLESIKVDTQSVIEATAATEIKVNTAVYDVKPIATVTTTITTDAGTETITEKVELTNDDLNGQLITVRLAVLSTSAKVARITHKGSAGYEDEVFYTDILGEGQNQYVEIQMKHFSEVDVETLTATTEESHMMGRQYKIVNGTPDANGEGRAIIPLSASELEEIGNNDLIVYGGEGDKRTEFTIDCAYTYFFNDGAKVEASSIPNYAAAAVLIIDKDASGNDISGYGYYEFYKGEKSEANFLFYALFENPVKD